MRASVKSTSTRRSVSSPGSPASRQAGVRLACKLQFSVCRVAQSLAHTTPSATFQLIRGCRQEFLPGRVVLQP